MLSNAAHGRTLRFADCGMRAEKAVPRLQRIRHRGARTALEEIRRAGRIDILDFYSSFCIIFRDHFLK